MPIEDVDYLLKNSNPNSFILKVDSSLRNKRQFPTPSEFAITFESPYGYVYGVDVLDASMPSSMFNIESFNNGMKYHLIWRNPSPDLIGDTLSEDAVMSTFFYDAERIPTLQRFMDKRENNRILFVNEELSSHPEIVDISEGVIDDNCLAIRKVLSGIPLIRVNHIDFTTNLTYFQIHDGVFGLDNKYDDTRDILLTHPSSFIKPLVVSPKMKTFRFRSPSSDDFIEIPVEGNTTDKGGDGNTVFIFNEAHVITSHNPENEHRIPISNNDKSNSLVLSPLNSTLNSIVYHIGTEFYVWDEIRFNDLSDIDRRISIDILSNLGLGITEKSSTDLERSRALLNGFKSESDSKISFKSRSKKSIQSVEIAKDALEQIELVHMIDLRLETIEIDKSGKSIALKLDLVDVMLFQVSDDNEQQNLDMNNEVDQSTVDNLFAFGNKIYVYDAENVNDVDDKDEAVRKFMRTILHDERFIDTLFKNASVFEVVEDVDDIVTSQQSHTSYFVRFILGNVTYQLPLGPDDFPNTKSGMIRVGEFNQPISSLSTTESSSNFAGREGREYSKIKLPFEMVRDNFMIDKSFYIRDSDRSAILYAFGEYLFYWNHAEYLKNNDLVKNIIDTQVGGKHNDENYNYIDKDISSSMIDQSSDGTFYYEVEYKNRVYVIASMNRLKSIKILVSDSYDDLSFPDSEETVFLIEKQDTNNLFNTSLLIGLPLFKLDENSQTDIKVFNHPDLGDIELFEESETNTLYLYHDDVPDPINEDIASFIEKILHDIILNTLDIESLDKGDEIEITDGITTFEAHNIFKRFNYHGRVYIISATFLIHIKDVNVTMINEDHDISYLNLPTLEETELRIILPLRYVERDHTSPTSFITNKELALLYLINDNLYVWSARPTNGLEHFQYVKGNNYTNTFFIQALSSFDNDASNSSFLEAEEYENGNKLRVLDTEISFDSLDGHARINFAIDLLSQYSLSLVLDTLSVDTSNIRISTDSKRNTYFSVSRSLLTSIIYYETKLISDIEYTNIIKNSNEVQGVSDLLTAPLVWCPLILFNGFVQIEPANYDAFSFLEELNIAFERAVSIGIKLERGNINVNFPFVDVNHNLSARRATRAGDISRSGQLKLVTGRDNLSFMIDLRSTTMRDVLGFSSLRGLNQEKRFRVVQRYREGDLISGITEDERQREGNNEQDKITIMSIPRDPNDSIISRLENGHEIKPPGVINLLGIRYVVLRCPEIESLIGTHSFGSSTPGIGVFVLGLNQQTIKQRLDFVHYVRKPFHPIEKLHRLTFRFEINDGRPYDFKGVDMFMILQINTYAPVKKVDFDPRQSILQPNYNPDFIQYSIDEDKKVEAQMNYTQNPSDNEEEYDSEEANEIVPIQNQYDQSEEEEEGEEEKEQYRMGFDSDPRNINIH